MEESTDAKFEGESSKEIREHCVKSLANMIVLKTIKEGLSPIAAYDIIGKIHMDYKVLISPGAIYPVLKSFERRGLIKGERIKRKRVIL